MHGHISVERFSHYFDRKIEELGLDAYIAGGISFGFLVVNNAKLDHRCKAIIAMEPFVNTRCLSMSYLMQRKYAAISLLMRLIGTLNMESAIWSSNWFRNYLQKQTDYPRERIETILEHIDARTFFRVAGLLMNYTKNPKFHNLPYFLVGNFADTTIDFSNVVEIFIQHLRELHVTSEPLDHYPKDLTKQYFKDRIPTEHIKRMLECIEG